VRFRTPTEVRDRVPGERVLAWMPVGESSLVATDTALVLPEDDGRRRPAGPELRVPWDRVLRASWEPEIVEVTAQPESGGRPVVHRVRILAEPGVLPEVVRERVTSSIVVQHHALLEGERGARFVARRVPNSTDLRWSVVFDAGLDPADPELRSLADLVLGDLRASLGI
jgi:hypothetical protein